MKSKFYLGDCVKVMEDKFADSCIDVIVTSPPYNIGVKYNSYEDNKHLADYLRDIYFMGKGCHRVLKPGGSMFLVMGSKVTSPRLPMVVIQMLLGDSLVPLFRLQNVIHWVKSITVPGREGEPYSVGHYKPINSTRFLNDCHEYIFHLTKSGEVPLDRKAIGVPYVDKRNEDRWGSAESLRCRGNCWFIPYKTITSRDRDRPHPATFPSKLARMCITLHGGEGLQVLDPYVGIGNSGVGARESGCVEVFHGIDIDESYLEECDRQLRGSG